MSHATTDESVRALAGALARARHIAVLTGAGVSAESGIRTFRDTMEGLWKEFDPATLATPRAFARDPGTVSRWYDHRRLGCLAAEPNAAHNALAELERRTLARAGRFTLITQNVDRLHQRAGSRSVVELHGSIIEWRCTITGRRTTPPAKPLPAFPPPSPFHPEGLLRPDVVWFGEMLPESAVEAADEAARACDLFLSIGTSSVVYPAAGFIELAHAHGARVAEINLDATPLSSRAAWTIREKAGVALPGIVAAMPA